MRRLPFIAIGAGFWALFYGGTYRILSYIRSMELFGEILSERLFSMTFFSLAGFLALSNIITALSSFYMSRDIPFLLTKPVPTRDIIRIKSFETILNSSWMVLSFIPPVFFAYGVSYGASAGYYLAIFAALLMFIIITAGAGISVAHLLAWIFPAKRSRDVLLGLGLVLFVALYFILRSVIPSDLATPEDIIQSFIKFRSDSPLLPGHWVTGATLPMLRHKGPDIFYMLVLFSNSVFFLLVSSMVGRRLYQRNIEKLQPSEKGAGAALLKNYYPDSSFAIIYKDVKIFFRDTGQWSQIFIIGALLIVYVYNFRSVPVDAISGLSPYIREIMVMVNMVMAGLVLSAVAGRFLYTAVSLEGQAFWIIRASPVRIKKFLWSKFLYGAVPVTSLIVLMIYLTNSAMHAGGSLMYTSLGTAFMLCISICGLGTGLGAIYPKFKYENIASVSMSIGGMAFMVIAFSLVLVTLSLEAWIFYLCRTMAAINKGADIYITLQVFICLGLIILINCAALYLPMKTGEKILLKDME